MNRRSRIRDLYEHPLDGEAIERASFATIDREVQPGAYSPEEWRVVRRLIHASADLSLNGLVRFSPDALARGIDALAAARPIVVDSNMIRAGLSLARLGSLTPAYSSASIHCTVSDAQVGDAARKARLPRALFAVRACREHLAGAIVLFGNSPVGLLELNRLVLEDGVQPALVVGMPVGFVHVQESKDELMTLPVPWIVITGRRGGSPLAVATLHALCELAGRRQPTEQAAGPPPASGPIAEDAIILLGHGSRVPRAGDSMLLAAAALRRRHGHARVEICFMSRLGPHFPETFERCVAGGARRIVVVPYFLHGGLHIELDIPEMLQGCAAAHPEVRLVLGDRLGYHDCFVEVLEQRICAARTLPHVREVVIPGRDRFPVPSGQDEFVPMSPEVAARWRAVLEAGYAHEE